MANKEVDKRIVEMQFDGKDFDKNIRASQKNLEDFKASMNFDDAAKQMASVAEVSNPINNAIMSMSKNLGKLAKEFTGVGSVGSFVAKKIKGAWQGAINSTERFLKSLTSEQITEGKKKFDMLTKSVMTIKNATHETEEEVYRVMDELMEYTDMTSYSFSDMSSNISKFTTVGIDLSDAEKEMEGIANWAALAGQGPAEASRAMFNISQAMSAGYMQKLDWKSIQNASMDIRDFRKEALEAAVAAGTLKKGADGVYKTVKGGKTVTVDNFVDTLKYKWFDKSAMEKVFKTFGDNTKGIGQTAYKAAQRCLTLNDAVGAWKDMLSTKWLQSYQLVFGKLTDAMGLFSGLCDKFGGTLEKLADIRNGILSSWNANGGRDSLWGALVGELETPDGDTLFAGAYGLLDAIQDLGDAITDAFWNFVGRFVGEYNQDWFAESDENKMAFLGSKLNELTKSFQDFTNSINGFLNKAAPGETETRMDKIGHVAEAIFAVIKMVVDIAKGIGQFVGEIITQLGPSIHVIENLISWICQLFTGAVADGAKKNVVGNFFHGLAETLRPLTTAVNFIIVGVAKLIALIANGIHQSGALEKIGVAFKVITQYISQKMAEFVNSGVFQKIFTWMANAASKIPSLVSKIKTLGAVVLNFVKNSKATKGITSLFSRLFGGKSLKDVLKNIKTSITDLVKNIPTILPSLTSGLGGLVGKISDFFGSVFSGIFGAGSASAEDSNKATEEISEAIVKPIKDLGNSDIVGKAVDAAKPGILNNLKSKLSELWGSISGFFKDLGNSEGLKKVKEFFEGTSFKDLMVNAKDILKWLAIFRGGSGLVSMGKGIKSLGKGVKVFSKNMKNLNLTGIFSGMFNISNVINSNNSDSSVRKNFDFGKLGNQLLQLAGSIFLIALAAEKIAKMKPEELKQAGISIGIVIAALIGAGWLAKKFTGNGAGLLALALGVLALIVPMKILQKMAWPVLLSGVAKLSAIVLLLALAGRIAGNVKMKGFLGMALAINLLLLPLKILSNMPILTDSGKLTSIAQGFGMLIALMLSMAGAARLTGGKKMTGMISMALALTILLIPIKTIAAMDLGKAAQGVVALLLIMAGIVAMIRITNGAQANKLAGIVGAVAILVAIGAMIGKGMNWQQVLIGFGPILGLLLMMGFMIKEASKLNAEQIKGLKAIFTALAIIVVVMGAVTIAISEFKVSTETLAVFMGGIIALLLSVGIMIKLVKKTDSKSIQKTTLVMLAISLLVGVAGAALIGMSKANVDWKLVALFIGGLTLLIVGIGYALPKLAKLDIKGALIAIAALALAVIAIMGAIGLMLPFVLGKAGDALQSISERLKTMSGLLKDFFDRMETITEESAKHALAIFDVLKDMVLGFAGFGEHTSDIRNFTSQLNYLGSGLDMFFLNEANYPDPKESKTFKTLDKLFEISPSLVAFNVGTFPDQVLYLGVALGLFNAATKDITSSEPPALGLLQGIFGQADNIEKFTKLPLDAFTSQMTGLGGAMSLYAKGAKEVTGLETDSGDEPDISKSIEILKSVCNAISGEDGSTPFVIPDNMPDSTKLGLFAGQLESLGTALSTFATAAHEMETDTGNAIDLLKFLGEIGGYVTKDNLDVVNRFDEAGVDSGSDGKSGKLGQFALDIGALGTALSSFATNIGGNEAAFTTGLGILEKFNDLNQRLTVSNLAFLKVFKNAGLEGSGNSNTALSQFATDIGALGHALASFAQNAVMDDGTQADFDYALRALNFLATLKNRLPDTGGLQELINGHKLKLDELGDEVQGLGQGMHDFSDKISGVGEDGTGLNYEAINGALSVVKSLVELTNAMSLINPETGNIYGTGFFVMHLNELMGAINEGYLGEGEGETIADRIVKFATSLSTAFDAAGGVNTDAVNAFANIAQGLNNLMAIDPSLNFEYPGEMISIGIQTGITNGKSGVIQAAIDVVQAAIDAANQTADSHSPSRVFAKLGEYMDMGLVEGMSGKQDDVESASGEMTQTAIDKAALVMAAISSAMAESLDLQPTITPILDLSNVTSAGAVLDSLFDGYALNLNSVLDRASAATSNSGPTEVIVQNAPDLTGIETSIQTLQTNITDLQTAITNMRVVLDSGVLAGQLTNDIDINLGRRSLYASRRN